MIRRIAVLPGDGVGAEVLAGPLKLLEAMEQAGRVELTGPWAVGASAFGELGTGLPESTLASCDAADALFFGAAGEHPGVALTDYRPEHAIIGLRQRYNLCVSIRSINRGESSSPIIVVRNLLSGAYGDASTRIESNGTSAACDKVILTAEQITELAEMACSMVERGLAANIISVDKANLLATSRLWREVTDQVAKSRGVPIRHCYVDRMAFELAHDDVIDNTVILTEGIFGDILSDLAAGRAGSIALCGSASVNPDPSIGAVKVAPSQIALCGSASVNPDPSASAQVETCSDEAASRRCVGLFEPVHGSAPRHMGVGTVNPSGAYLALVALLEWFEETADLAPVVSTALNHTLRLGPFTYDLAPPGTEPVDTNTFANAVNTRAVPELKELL